MLENKPILTSLHDEPEPHKHGGLWAFVLLMAMAAGAGGWYFYQQQSKQDGQLAFLSGMQTTMDGVKSRVDAAENGLLEWNNRWGKLDARFTQVERKAGAAIAAVKSGSQKMMAELETKLDARFDQKLNEKTAVLQTRIETMESASNTQQARLNRMENDLTDSRREIADLRAETAREVGTLQTANGRSAGRIDTLERLRKNQRVDFELAAHRTQHLLPGVTLAVDSIDPRYQRYSGYVYLLTDRRYVWIKNQDAQSPVLIYPKAGGQALRLVVNQVTKRDVTGYLLVPESQAAYAQAGEVGSETATASTTGGR